MGKAKIGHREVSNSDREDIQEEEGRRGTGLEFELSGFRDKGRDVSLMMSLVKKQGQLVGTQLL